MLNIVTKNSSNVSGVDPIEECSIATTIANDDVDMNAAMPGTIECGSEPLREKYSKVATEDVYFCEMPREVERGGR